MCNTSGHLTHQAEPAYVSEPRFQIGVTRLRGMLRRHIANNSDKHSSLLRFRFSNREPDREFRAIAAQRFNLTTDADDVRLTCFQVRVEVLAVGTASWLRHQH